MPKAAAPNLIDARWVPKWKKVQGKLTTHAWLMVRGFKELQASQLSTSPGATSRWSQRAINSVAAQMGWTLFSAYVFQAFRRGLTFDEAAKEEADVVRDVQFTIPPGSLGILQQLTGFEDFN